MGMSAFCTTCQRTVYVEDGETPVCPVCSSPLLETIEADDTKNGGAQTPGEK